MAALSQGARAVAKNAQEPGQEQITRGGATALKGACALFFGNACVLLYPRRNAPQNPKNRIGSRHGDRDPWRHEVVGRLRAVAGPRREGERRRDL